VPLPDGSVDAVLSTVVLCSVRDQERAVAEAVRVLRPGGRFVFFEHVAAPEGTWTRRLQGLSAPFSRLLDHGCDPTRQTWRTLERSGLRELDVVRLSLGRWPFIGGSGVA
jgi:ubiquinone/menaquinone biosynthesis C-methylase UbiE